MTQRSEDRLNGRPEGVCRLVDVEGSGSVFDQESCHRHSLDRRRIGRFEALA